MDRGSRGSSWVDAERTEALWRESRALVRLSEQTRARARASRDQVLRGRAQREILHEAAFARLQARAATMAVIEQATGIIMAQQECGPEEASGLLRRASQRAHVNLHQFGTQLIEQIAPGKDAGTATPIRLAATRHQEPRTQAQRSAGVGPGRVTIGDSGPGGSTRPDAGYVEAVRREPETLVHSLDQSTARARATRDQIRRGRPQREILQGSAFARLQARMGTMAVIEQATGIIMAQQECGPDEAFDLLRRASQRANVKAHALAAQIIAHVASPPAEATAQPTQPAASRHP